MLPSSVELIDTSSHKEHTLGDDKLQVTFLLKKFNSRKYNSLNKDIFVGIKVQQQQCPFKINAVYAGCLLEKNIFLTKNNVSHGEIMNNKSINVIHYFQAPLFAKALIIKQNEEVYFLPALSIEVIV